MKRSAWLLVVLALPALVAAIAPAHAQVGNIIIQGSVTLEDGSPVDGAEVTALPAVEARGIRHAKSGKDGRFKIPFAQFGAYKFLAEKEGLRLQSMSIVVTAANKQIEYERSGDVLDLENPPEFEIGPGHTADVRLVMVPADQPTREQIAANQALAQEIAEAGRLTGAGEYAASDEILKKIMGAGKGDVDVLYLMGINAARSGRAAEAETMFTKARELDPAKAGVASQLGALAYEKGDREKAVEWFRKELEVSPAALPVAVNLAICLNDLGRTDEAVAAWKKVIEMSPAETGAYLELAAIYTEMGKTDEATEVLKQAEQAGKPDAVRWFNVGASFANKDQFDRAEMAFRRALEIDPALPEANREMGYLMVRKGENAQALVHFRAYLERRADAKDADEVKAIIRELERTTPGAGKAPQK
jgi:tetratricopeptide (TPR) repeat protein